MCFMVSYPSHLAHHDSISLHSSILSSFIPPAQENNQLSAALSLDAAGPGARCHQLPETILLGNSQSLSKYSYSSPLPPPPSSNIIFNPFTYYILSSFIVK